MPQTAVEVGLKDPFDPMQVDWAMATRFQADKDLIVIPRIACSTLDPSCLEARVTAGKKDASTVDRIRTSSGGKKRTRGANSRDASSAGEP
jgi:3-polyprenyl-4-hydroxybenzoate decarboxylase